MMIYRRRISEEKLIVTPAFWNPVIRKRVGYEIYYRWEWSGFFDKKLKTVWRKGFKDFKLGLK